jgi:NitT/TauT family transport system permease protein
MLASKPIAVSLSDRPKTGEMRIAEPLAAPREPIASDSTVPLGDPAVNKDYFARLSSHPLLRRLVLLLILAIVWQIYASWLNHPLLLPTFSATAKAFWVALRHGEFLARVATPLKILLTPYAAGIALAGTLTAFASSTRLGAELLETLTAMLNPLPAIALLPLALLWFGLGAPSILFVLVHAVVWPLALNAHSGFSGVSPALRMVGQNYGLTRMQFVLKILIPAAFPSILTGLKIGWAFAWRTLIAAELVFGVSSGSGGLGWFIYENKNLLETDRVFAGLGTVILIGLVVDALVFRVIENKTVRRWGMKA